MSIPSRLCRGSLFAVAFLLWGLITAHAAPPVVTTAQNASSLGKYEVYELTMMNSAAYTYPNDEVTIAAVFTAPSLKTYAVGGFHYGPRTWKVRFAPPENGAWTWTLSFADAQGVYTTSGSFTATPSSRTGFLRVHPANPVCLITEADSQPFYPIGINSPWYTPGYLASIATAGMNIARNFGGGNTQFVAWSGDFNVNGSGNNRYDTAWARKADSMLQNQWAAGIKSRFTFWNSPWDKDLSTLPVKKATKNYHQYLINRYGAYVDIWELGNSAYFVYPQLYLDTMTAYIHNHDPYRHLVTDGGAQPGDIQAGIDMVSDNKYATCDDVDVDKFIAAIFDTLKSRYNRPMLLGEGGGASPQGNYSPLRYRLHLWSALLNQGGICFWPTAMTKFPVSVGLHGEQYAESNQYIGYEEKAASKIMADFSCNFDGATAPLSVTLSPTGQMRGYALGSATDQMIYIVHSANHNTPLSGATVRTTLPVSMEGQWLDPVTGQLVERISAGSGVQTLTIPTFNTDIVLRLRPASTVPVLQFGTPSYLVNGDQTSVTLTVFRMGGSRGSAVTADYATADGIARAGVDYTRTSGRLSWAANDTSPKTITIPLTVDNRMVISASSVDRDFRVVLSGLTGNAVPAYSLSARVEKVNVVWNTVSLSEGGYIVPNRAGTLTVQVNRTGNGTGPISMYYYTGGGGGGTDYTAIPANTRTLNWADGDMAPKTFNVDILSTARAGNSFRIELFRADTFSTALPFYRAGVVIVDPATSAGVLSFTGHTGTVTVGYGWPVACYSVNGKAGSATARVSRRGGGHGAVSVPWATQTVGMHVGTARPGIDYTDRRDTLRWADGDTADKFITVPIADNTAAETRNTTFYIYLLTPTGGAISNNPATAEITIMNTGTGGTSAGQQDQSDGGDRLSVFPNPFNPSTTIRIQVDRDPAGDLRNEVDISIMDIGGKIVRRMSQTVPAGRGVFTKVIPWNGRDLTGKNVASGAYFLTMKYHGRVMKQRMMLVR